MDEHVSFWLSDARNVSYESIFEREEMRRGIVDDREGWVDEGSKQLSERERRRERDVERERDSGGETESGGEARRMSETQRERKREGEREREKNAHRKCVCVRGRETEK